MSLFVLDFAVFWVLGELVGYFIKIDLESKQDSMRFKTDRASLQTVSGLYALPF